MPRKRSAIFFLVYFCGVLHISFYPWKFVSPPHHTYMFWVLFGAPRIVLDFVLNVMLYVPLGAAATIVLGNGLVSLPIATTTCFLISFGVEWTQRYIPFRVGTFNDLAANVLGASLGAIIAFAWRRRLPKAAILAMLWLLWNGSLLLPAINRAPLPPSGRDADLLWIGSINAFLGFLAISLALKPNLIPTVILALAPIPGLWLYPTVLLARLTATSSALLVAHFAKSSLSRFIGPACLIWLVFQELYPFNWESHIQAFSWIPFASLFSNRPQLYYPVVFGKLFFYTAVVWAMGYGSKILPRSFVLPAVVLLAGELAQCFLPGRTPELTDLVLMAGGAFVLWLSETSPVLSSGRTAPAGVGYEISGTKQ
jgi:VanZ family protein